MSSGCINKIYGHKCNWVLLYRQAQSLYGCGTVVLPHSFQRLWISPTTYKTFKRCNRRYLILLSSTWVLPTFNQQPNSLCQVKSNNTAWDTFLSAECNLHVSISNFLEMNGNSIWALSHTDQILVNTLPYFYSAQQIQSLCLFCGLLDCRMWRVSSLAFVVVLLKHTH